MEPLIGRGGGRTPPLSPGRRVLPAAPPPPNRPAHLGGEAKRRSRSSESDITASRGDVTGA